MSKKIILLIAASLIIIISIIIIISVLYFYVRQFGNNGLSDNTRDWAYFGEYIGGLINPIIALLNLIVLSSLTYYAYKHQKQYSKISVIQNIVISYIKSINELVDQINISIEKTNHISASNFLNLLNDKINGLLSELNGIIEPKDFYIIKEHSDSFKISIQDLINDLTEVEKKIILNKIKPQFNNAIIKCLIIKE